MVTLFHPDQNESSRYLMLDDRVLPMNMDGQSTGVHTATQTTVQRKPGRSSVYHSLTSTRLEIVQNKKKKPIFSKTQ